MHIIHRSNHEKIKILVFQISILVATSLQKKKKNDHLDHVKSNSPRITITISTKLLFKSTAAAFEPSSRSKPVLTSELHKSPIHRDPEPVRSMMLYSSTTTTMIIYKLFFNHKKSAGKFIKSFRVSNTCSLSITHQIAATVNTNRIRSRFQKPQKPSTAEREEQEATQHTLRFESESLLFFFF